MSDRKGCQGSRECELAEDGVVNRNGTLGLPFEDSGELQLFCRVAGN